ncbi:MAG TPA: glycosyl hydrolase-related protein [Bacteroidales bacterium]|nr:glycosyl hydrolase-related protein [Bacteroidales bacterium]
MNHNKILTLFLFVFLTLAGWAQREISINYYKPYQFKSFSNQKMAKVWINGDELGKSFTVTLNGKDISCSKADSGRFELYLPLTGEDNEIVFYCGNKSANSILSRQMFKPLISSDWGYFGKGTIHIICSSHQDIAWMNTPDSCREERIHDIIIPALDQIGKNPAFRFEMEQTLNLMEVLESVPKEKQRIIDAYKNGQFTWGATFNQPYEGLESGEQLVRQAYFGRKWIKENLPGMDAFAAYNIDVPGRTPQIPQILKKSGIKFLVISRMKEGFYNWYSPDGSKVLTYSLGNYGWALLVYQYFESDVVTAFQKLNSVLKNWDDYYAERNIPPHYGVVISTDAGGPKDYTPIINEWNDIAKNSGFDIPLLRHSTAEDFLHEINVPEAKFDSISGERPDLWLYIHGPAHYQAIKAKKSAAVMLRAAEMFSSLNGIINKSLGEYPAGELMKGWYNSIYPDHGWGGKNGSITDSIFRASLEMGDETGTMILNQSLKSLSGAIEVKKPSSILVFNDLSWQRDGIVSIDVSSMKGTGWRIIDTDGNSVPSALSVSGSKRTITFKASDVPSLGYKTFYLEKGVSKDKSEVNAGENFCENSFFRVELGSGGITSLYDKQIKKEVFNTSKYAGGDILHFGYNGNGAGEFVRITPVNFEGFESLSMKNQQWTLKSNSAVASVYESVSYMSNFTVKQIITVYHQIRKIDFEYEIPDWPGIHNRQIRVVFPLAMNEAQVTYDVPMGIVNVNRDELNISPRGWSWEGTYRQMPAEIHPREIENFISASNDSFGVTMSTNLAVADWIDPGRESVDYPVLQGILLSSHKSCHYLGNWYSQKGSHSFRFTLFSHQPGWQNGYQFGVEGNHPLYPVVMDKPQKGIFPAEMSFINFSSPLVRVTALKKDDKSNSLILRVVNMEEKKKNVDMKLWFPAVTFIQTNIIEEDLKDTGQKGKEVKIELGKNSIETFRIGIE